MRHRHRHLWHGPWGLWAHMDPEVRQKILAEARRAYGEKFGDRHPWDRVFNEFVGRRPGWHQRIRWELRLHYGAHLHRRLFLWFGAAIFLSVVTTLAASHFGHRDHAAHPLRALCLFGVPALILWVASGRVARRIARPLYQLTRAAQELGQGNLKARVAAERFGFDELAVLSHAFNDMAGRLERQRADERELLAAVSHELRTPLSRIRLLVEIGRQSAGPQPRTLDEIEREAIEIDALVGELLASARLDFQAVTPKPLDAVEAARRALEREEADKLLDNERLTKDALFHAESNGIVFLDEIDKICARSSEGGFRGADVSREGVQRDLLPLIEGTTVNTKYGPVKTDHILFIASGAFHMAKPSDLLPELQGRLPIRVELNALSEEDMLRILTEPESSLTKQYTSLLSTENVHLSFTKDGVEELAAIATRINGEVEDIGARRLYTLVERVLEDVSFDAPELAGDQVVIDAAYVRERVEEIATNDDISNFIL